MKNNSKGHVSYLGNQRKQISLFESIVLILSGTIGAGILGIPYAISKVGILLGVFYIVCIGLLMMGLNLLLGEVAIRTKTNLQLFGLAKKYLGRFGGGLMLLVTYFTLFGVLTVYIIGVGQSLATLCGGNSFFWSILFFIFGSFLIFLGLRTIKTVESFLIFGVLFVLLILSFISLKHFNLEHASYLNFAEVFFPYGILIFAFHSAGAIPETHSLLVNKEQTFKKAIVWSSLITILIYVIFSVIIVGVTGQETTEIASIGLGKKIGPLAILFANIFAIFSMGTSFLMSGVTFRDSIKWDFKMGTLFATIIACGVPFLLFLFGLRSFIKMIDLVGGLFGSIELFLIVLIYLKARKQKIPMHTSFHLKHTFVLISVLLLAFSIGAVYSLVKLF